MRSIGLMPVALALAGCGGTPEPAADTRPQWRGAAVDGLAPLMTPREVAAALARHGYVQVRCTGDSPLYADPLNGGGDIPCYRSPRRPMRISLFFLELHEGRRLAVVNFRRDDLWDLGDAGRLAASRDFAQRVRARFGPPFTTSDTPQFRTFYWKVPGGMASLPDMIDTTVGTHFPPNLTMTSMWAYGQTRPSP